MIEKLNDSAAIIVEELEHMVDEREGHGISVQDIERLMAHSVIGDEINLFPSTHKGPCCRFAVFVSLSAKRYLGKQRASGHMSFGQMLQAFVKHMQGDCPNVSKDAIILTDSWDANAWEYWQNNIEEIQRHAKVAIYLIKNRRAVRVG